MKSKARVTIKVKGGPGSGNYGHRGIPGKVGGSSPRGAGAIGASANPMTLSIINEFNASWGGTPVDDEIAVAVVQDIIAAKRRGNKLIDKLTDTYNISYGAAKALIATAKTFLTVSHVQQRSAVEARITRLGSTVDSSGRRRVRKYN